MKKVSNKINEARNNTELWLFNIRTLALIGAIIVLVAYVVVLKSDIYNLQQHQIVNNKLQKANK